MALFGANPLSSVALVAPWSNPACTYLLGCAASSVIAVNFGASIGNPEMLSCFNFFSFFIDTTLHLQIQFFFVSCCLLPILVNCCLPTWFKNSCYTFPMFLANSTFLLYTFPDLRTRDTARGVPGHVLHNRAG